MRGQYPANNDEYEATMAAVARLGIPASERWIGQRVVVLLTHYFVANSHPDALEAVANDWIRELRGYPEWAIDAACEWWLSRHNSKRHKKPLPGDISARAHIEAAIVSAARSQCQYFERYGNNPPAFLKR